MLKGKKSAQNHTLLSENIRNRLWEKITGYWICKNNWSINRLTGYGVTALMYVLSSLKKPEVKFSEYANHIPVGYIAMKIKN